MRSLLMRSLNLVWLAALSFPICSLIGPTPALADAPHWIWSSAEPANGTDRDKAEAAATWRFTRRVRQATSVQEARLQFAADGCRASVAINGRHAVSVEPYCPTQRLDVTPWLKLGDNEIAIVASQADGPPAVALSLDIRPTTGERVSHGTDEHWSVARHDARHPNAGAPANGGPTVADLGLVAGELWGLGRRDIRLSPDDNYEQWQQSLAADAAQHAPKFWTAPGFTVTEVRVAQPDEGSWISMAFDAQGRLTVSREDRGLLRLTLDDARRTVQRVERIDAELLECRGLVYHDGWLFANANNSKALYRLKINDAGQATEMTKVRGFSGGVGHGRNDLAWSDAGLYSIHGDSVDPPDEPKIDRTSPLRESLRSTRGKEGHLLRIAPDGNGCEILCAGLRNPYGVAVHPRGDRFTFDADNEYDMGAPWYRPTRILNLVTGGDFGYREATGAWPPRFHDQPDNLPPVLDIGRSSPTSVMFGESLAFPPEYQRALYALDWTYGRVIAVHLATRGAGWRANSELFLQGRPLNVTDIAAGPDGAMYLITGGRKTQSALYKVAYSGPRASTVGRSPHEERQERFTQTQLARLATLGATPTGDATADRAKVERATTSDLDVAWGMLGHDDPVLRHAARVAVERHPLERWRARALAAPRGTAGLQALLALARARVAQDVPELVEQLVAYRPGELRVGDQLTWLRVVGLCLATAPDETRLRRADLSSRIEEAWSGGTSGGSMVALEGTADEVRRRVALLLGEFDAPALPALAAADLLVSQSQEDRLAALLALRHQRQGWTIDLRRNQLEALRGIRNMVGGQGMPTFQDKLRSETLATLTDEERTALEDLLAQPDEPDEPLPASRPVVKKWTLEDLAPLYRPDAAPGDKSNGQRAFQQALCSRCHRVGLQGPAVGPDLTFVAGRFSKRDILESILLPSLSVAENYRAVIVVTDDGKVHSGRVVAEGDYRSQKLKLNSDPLYPGRTVEIDKRDIVESRTSDVSPMPQGLLDTLTLEEIRDLLAYLQSGG